MAYQSALQRTGTGATGTNTLVNFSQQTTNASSGSPVPNGQGDQGQQRFLPVNILLSFKANSRIFYLERLYFNFLTYTHTMISY